MMTRWVDHVIDDPEPVEVPPPKKVLSPASRVKADKRNAQLREKRAADAAASGGAKIVER